MSARSAVRAHRLAFALVGAVTLTMLPLAPAVAQSAIGLRPTGARSTGWAAPIR